MYNLFKLRNLNKVKKMLLKYSIENYKSIKKKETINFNAKPLKQHKDHLLNKKVLPVIALYGPNGGGKTAILESIRRCKAIILPESMLSSEYFKKLENLKNDESNPIKWEFTFLDDANRELKYNIHFSNKITFEEFKIKDPLISVNEWKIIFRKDNNLEDDDIYDLGDELNLNEQMKKMMTNPTTFSLRKTSLLFFFSEFIGIEIVVNLFNQFKKIIWIDNTFAINKKIDNSGNPFFNIGKTTHIETIVENITESKEIILSIFKDLDINITNIKIEKQSFKGPASGSVIITLCKKDLYEEEYWINYNDESNGTQKLIILLSEFIKGINNKNIFLIDELDSGIHTKILKYLILMFMKKNKGAQLLFSSHDMPTLSSSIFRKDEIYFAAINDSKFTSIVSLWEFGSDVREANNFAKTYLDGKLGYDPYVDYSLKGFKSDEE